MSYEDAKEMLKQESVSLTVLKHSISTTSSHRSLSHNTEDQITELSLDKTFPFSEVSTSTGGAVSSSLHYRSPSAPLHTFPAEHMLSVHSDSHIKSMSVINRMSDDDIRKMLNELQDEQKRRIQLDIITEGKPHRYETFMKKIGTGSSLPNDFLPQHLARPVSMHSSKASVTSSCGSNSRYEGSIPSSPLNISRSDPLALDKARHFQVFGTSNTNNASSGLRKKPYASVVTKSYVTHSPHQRASIHDVPPNTPPTSALNALSNVTDDFLSLNLNSSLGHAQSTHHHHHFSHNNKNTQSSSLPNYYQQHHHHQQHHQQQQHSVNADLSDRCTSHSSMSMSKHGSKSCSSHSSLASETLDKITSNSSQYHHVEPVDEEVELPLLTSPDMSPPTSSPRLSLITTSRSSSTKQRSSFSMHSSLTIGLPATDDMAQ